MNSTSGSRHKQKFRTPPPEIEYVIGHFEYPNFDGTELWLEKDAGYRTEKTDPGKEFIHTIRQETSKYNWKPVPEIN